MQLKKVFKEFVEKECYHKEQGFKFASVDYEGIYLWKSRPTGLRGSVYANRKADWGYKRSRECVIDNPPEARELIAHCIINSTFAIVEL